jgi:phosphate/phosphite/phosphonate ABC transporter binding protein
MKKINIIFIIIPLVLVSIVVFYFYSNSANLPMDTQPNGERIGVGLVSTNPVEIAKYQALIDYFNKESKNGWYLLPVSSYGSFIEKIQTGQIQGGFSGSAVGYKLLKESTVLPVFRPVRNGSSWYRSVIIARRDSGVEKIEDFAGKRFAYVDPFTSAGYLSVVTILKEKNINPENFFSLMTFVGSHDGVIQAVLSGEFDGGALKNTNWEVAIAKDPSILDKIKVIEEYGKFPDSTFVLGRGGDVDYEMKEIQSIMEKIKTTDEGKEAMRRFGATELVSTTDADFVEVSKLQENEY